MNLPFFAVKAYVPGGSRIRPKKIRKMPSGRYRYKNLFFQFAYARAPSQRPREGDETTSLVQSVLGKWVSRGGGQLGRENEAGMNGDTFSMEKNVLRSLLPL